MAIIFNNKLIVHWRVFFSWLLEIDKKVIITSFNIKKGKHCLRKYSTF